MYEIITHRFGYEIISTYETFEQMLRSFFWLKHAPSHTFEGVKVNGLWLLDNNKNIPGLGYIEAGGIPFRLGSGFLLTDTKLVLDENNPDHVHFFNELNA